LSSKSNKDSLGKFLLMLHIGRFNFVKALLRRDQLCHFYGVGGHMMANGIANKIIFTIPGTLIIRAIIHYSISTLKTCSLLDQNVRFSGLLILSF
jgi:hypothetical protein